MGKPEWGNRNGARVLPIGMVGLLYIVNAYNICIYMDIHVRPACFAQKLLAKPISAAPVPTHPKTHQQQPPQTSSHLFNRNMTHTLWILVRVYSLSFF